VRGLLSDVAEPPTLLTARMYDFVVVGGGIIGLATANAVIERFPNKRVLLLEKEQEICAHQSGRNSGVIHSGVYSKPGSLKAQLCRRGNASMVEFCRAQEIPQQICGKLIVATEESELPRLENLFQRGIENGIAIEKIGAEKLREIEPHASGIAAIRVPSTAIVNYRLVGSKLAAGIRERGGDIQFRARVRRITTKNETHIVNTTAGDFEARFLINCGGLYSDQVAEMTGAEIDMQIVPFRGEYFELKPERRHLVNGMIYPVPDPRFPFLGVHCTRTVDGGVHVGPNAVLALKREGYHKTDVDLRETWDMLRFPGFWKLAARYWSEGMKEMWRSLSKRAFVRDLQRLVPDIAEDDLVRAEAGVRAQAVNRDGSLVDDFVILKQQKALHVCNAPSPAATAALEIASHVVAMIP